MAKNELTTEGNTFNLVALSNELAEAINEEMDGLGTIQFDRVKIPSGGSVVFEVPSDDEENPDATKEIKGVILYHHPVNAYWKEKFNGSNEQPECSSFDGKTGVNRDTGCTAACASCPYNQFGSDPNGGSGKACKNVHRIYILRENNPVPIILSLPPTSIKAMRDYIGKRILLRGLRCYKAVTKISLKKDVNANGIAYSKVLFTFDGKLSAEHAEQAKNMAENIKAMNMAVDIDDADYNIAPNSMVAPDGFIDVGVSDEELPFD